jgi:hypothetical protein
MEKFERLWYDYQFVLWGLLFLLSLRLPPSPGRRFLALGFLLFAAESLAEWQEQWAVQAGASPNAGYVMLLRSFGRLQYWVFVTGGVCLLLGLTNLRAGGAPGLRPKGEGMFPRYYNTDELISRSASTPTANEDLEAVKNRWHDALGRFVREAPDETALAGTEKYARTLLLERCTPMGTFAGSPCGQLRSVLVRFAGPGDDLPWMSVTVTYAVDQATVGTFTYDNDEVYAARENPDRLFEFWRIERFLRTGEVYVRFVEGLGGVLLALARGLVLVPAAVPVVFAALAYAPVRALVRWGSRGTRFVPTRRPETLPPEWTGVPAGYWNALLPELAGQQKEVLAEVRTALEARAEAGLRTYEKDVVQWGGYTLKEVRRQTVLEYRRAKVYVSVYAYGKDLYVRWDSHINRETWALHKFAHRLAVGYRFDKSWLSWAVPLFTEVPDVFEFAPTSSPTTDYDWADVDALQDLAHEILTDTVRRLKERYHITKEIDFAMKEGQRGEAAAPQEGRDRDRKERKPLNWFARFSRQQ